MAQNPDEAWFYSQGGQQKGPVPFSELQAKVNANELHPANDMVWKQGMANWTPVGQMRDVFKVAEAAAPAPTAPAPQPKPEPEPAPAPAAPAAKPEPAPAPASPVAKTEPAPQPKQLPKAEPKPEPKPVVVKQALQAPTAKKDRKRPDAEIEGANRLHFFLGVYLFPGVWIAIFSFVLVSFGSGLGQGVVAALSLVGGLVPALVAIVVTLKRFTNLSMSRWWILGNLVPFLNLWVGYRLFACPWGYGGGRKMDGKGIVLAILYWLSIIGVVACIPFLVVIALTTAIDNPELLQDPVKRQQINEFLIQVRDLINSL